MTQVSSTNGKAQTLQIREVCSLRQKQRIPTRLNRRTTTKIRRVKQVGHLKHINSLIVKTLISMSCPTDFRVRGKKENFQTEADGMLFLFTKEDEASKTKRSAREKREHDILTMSTEQLQQEVLGPPLKGKDVSETDMDFVRKK
jgi:hypothetical protein